MTILMSYCPQFWGLRLFSRPMTLSTCLKGITKNLSFLHFRDVFVSYCPKFWSSEVIYKAHNTLYIFERPNKKNSSFLRFRTVFMSQCPFFWNSRAIYKEYDNLYILERDVKKTHHFWVLCPFSWAAHSFCVPGWFIRPMTLSTCLRGMSKNSSFLRFRAVFMTYCPLF
jgi:hypothetical protein